MIQYPLTSSFSKVCLDTGPSHPRSRTGSDIDRRELMTRKSTTGSRANVTTFSSHGQTRLRRAHRKVKTGCSECRKRRVKCSEEKPNCALCLRHGVACLYTNSTTAGTKTNTSEATTDTLTLVTEDVPKVSINATDPLPSQSNAVRTHAIYFSLHDLALYHHWILHASSTIVRASKLDTIWRISIPEIGFEHAFVLHAILSLSALHLVHVRSETSTLMLAKRYIYQAAQHHNEALAGFHQAMEASATETIGKGEAAFAFASMNIIYVFAMSSKVVGAVSGDQEAPQAHQERVLDWIPMVRGVEAIVQPFYTQIREGPLKPLLSIGNWSEIIPDEIEAPAMDDIHFRAIRAEWQASESEEDIVLYDRTLYLLRKALIYTIQFESLDLEALQSWGYHREHSGPMMWLFFAPEAYFIQLRRRAQSALLIFQYFGVLLHKLNSFWFLSGWGQDIVAATNNLMPKTQWSDWASMSVGLETQ